MKVRIPQQGGMPGNMSDMLRKAQKMQEDMARAQQELEEKTYTATAGGGAVSATVDGKHCLTTLEIQPEVVDPEDADMLADLIMAAVNEAVRAAAKDAEEQMGKITGGMNLPGMF